MQAMQNTLGIVQLRWKSAICAENTATEKHRDTAHLIVSGQGASLHIHPHVPESHPNPTKVPAHMSVPGQIGGSNHQSQVLGLGVRACSLSGWLCLESLDGSKDEKWFCHFLSVCSQTIYGQQDTEGLLPHVAPVPIPASQTPFGHSGEAVGIKEISLNPHL